jgi:hypothetical protein
MLLPSAAFLCTLDSAPCSTTETGLRLGTPDYSRFNILTRNISTILAVMKALKLRYKITIDSAEEEDDND